MLVLVCGLPGVGKSTLAKALSEQLEAVYLSSDIIRRKMLDERTYSEQEKYRVYENMVAAAKRLLASGKTVVCDATFYKKKTRGEMCAAARHSGAEVFFVKCILDEKTIEERMSAREQLGTSESEATFRIYMKVKGLFEEIEEDYLEIDTALPLEEQVEKVAAGLGGSLGWTPQEIMAPQAYPAEAEDVELKETHISWVFLAGEYAYKVKKPVKFSFLDFSTKEKRREFCEEEVRLNKRLAPEIYLDVVPLVREGQITKFEGVGRVIDYAVKMQRMKNGKTMDQILLEGGAVDAAEIEDLAKTISEFHAGVPSIQDPRYNSPEMVREQIDDLASVREVVEGACGMGEKIDFILQKSAQFIDENESLLRNRQADGMVRECHGDLHSGNIFMGEKKHIFDCIEFNEDFRCIDTASEIAFMAMDLDARGREDLGKVFVGKYVELSGDSELEKILGLYKCYRANVRAKVAALGYSQSPTEEGKENMEKYLLLAEKYAQEL